MSVTSKRSRLEIILDVLRATMRNQKPTRIMYASNLSWGPLQQILGTLVKQGLIRKRIVPEKRGEHRDRRTNVTYEITEKGARVLEYFKIFEKELRGENE